MQLSHFNNCKKCNMVFKPSVHNKFYCRICAVKNDADFDIIRDLIRRKGHLNALEISSMTELPIETVMMFVEELRLINSDVLTPLTLEGYKSTFHTTRTRK